MCFHNTLISSIPNRWEHINERRVRGVDFSFFRCTTREKDLQLDLVHKTAKNTNFKEWMKAANLFIKVRFFFFFLLMTSTEKKKNTFNIHLAISKLKLEFALDH